MKVLLFWGDIEKLLIRCSPHCFEWRFLHSSNKHVCALLGCSVLVWQPLKMKLPLNATAKCEVRAVIKFFNAKGVKQVEIHR